jgi:hypothetical protein
MTSASLTSGSCPSVAEKRSSGMHYVWEVDVGRQPGQACGRAHSAG